MIEPEVFNEQEVVFHGEEDKQKTICVVSVILILEWLWNRGQEKVYPKEDWV